VKDAPTVPLAESELVIAGGDPAAATVITRVAVPVPVMLVAPMVTSVDPEPKGVPVMAPVFVFMESPFGKGEAL
jgi:hypothetical protein